MLKDLLIKLKIKSKILIIAGSDSSGGAGIQADIKTVTSLGSYALTAITAVTVQNTQRCKISYTYSIQMKLKIKLFIQPKILNQMQLKLACYILNP